MDILVYGAGVLGGYLAHSLVRAGNCVTLLARGERLRELKEQGLVIRHALQLKTTRDRVELIDRLVPEARYDAVFVVMQYTQMPAVVPVLAQSQSKLFILIGNNASPVAMRNDILRADPEKTVLFGFLGAGGRRENGRIISAHTKPKLPIGSLIGEDYEPARKLLADVFEGSGIGVKFRSDMESYLLSHIAFIMPIAYACYATGGKLPKADKALLNAVIDATTEGYSVLKANGLAIAPVEDEAYVREKRSAYYRMLWIMTRTFLGRLAVSDHAMSAVGEMTALSEAFDHLKARAGIPTPVWDSLERNLNPVL